MSADALSVFLRVIHKNISVLKDKIISIRLNVHFASTSNFFAQTSLILVFISRVNLFSDLNNCVKKETKNHVEFVSKQLSWNSLMQTKKKTNQFLLKLRIVDRDKVQNFWFFIFISSTDIKTEKSKTSNSLACFKTKLLSFA